jgi:hypothetical protein
LFCLGIHKYRIIGKAEDSSWMLLLCMKRLRVRTKYLTTPKLKAEGLSSMTQSGPEREIAELRELVRALRSGLKSTFQHVYRLQREKRDLESIILSYQRDSDRKSVES